jgi:hypothetical protein
VIINILNYKFVCELIIMLYVERSNLETTFSEIFKFFLTSYNINFKNYPKMKLQKNKLILKFQ